jgi:hypothetical protein
VLERNGIQVGFVAASFSLNKCSLPMDKPWLCNHITFNEEHVDLSSLVDQAEIARKKGADVVVASIHAGCAYQAFPGSIVRNNLHRLCDEANVDVIIAGHPHHAQPIEWYTSAKTGKSHLIVYSLGDFIAYDIYKWGHLTLLLKLNISKGKLHGKNCSLVTGIEVKPAYMCADIRAGKVVKLRLLDYLKVKQHPEKYLSTSFAKKEFNELQAFFETLVFPPARQHILI